MQNKNAEKAFQECLGYLGQDQYQYQQSLSINRIIIIDMGKPIRTVGYRNGIFIGQTGQSSSRSSETPEGIGITVDDMFMSCLSSWSASSSESIKPSGPTLILYPHRQIFYSEAYPEGNRLRGFWAFLNSEALVYGNGEAGPFAVLQPGGNVVSKIQMKDNKLQYGEDASYSNEQQKWKIIEQTLSIKVQPSKRSTQRFIETNFMSRLNKEQNKQVFVSMKPNYRRDEQLYALVNNNEGIAFCLNSELHKPEVNSIGYYKEFQPSRHINFGRRYIDELNSSSYKVEEGNFQTGELFTFQFTEKRPGDSYKNCRKYFRQTTNFCNKFLQLSEADYAYKKLTHVQKQYITKIGSKYGQKIIQGEYEHSQGQEAQKIEPETHRSEKYRQGMHTNRQYSLQEAKAKIEQEINRKMTAGSIRPTGSFNLYSNSNAERKKQPETRLRSSNRNSIESSPVLNYNKGGYDELTSYPSKKRSPTKFNYTDSEQNYQPIVNNWQRQSKRNQYLEPKAGSPTRVARPIHPQPVPEKLVNEFTLYPVMMSQPEPIDYQFEERSARMRMEKERIVREIERELHREKELQLELMRNQEKENERRILENQHIRKQQNTFIHPTHLNHILRQTNSLLPLEAAVAVSSQYPHNDPAFKRKYFPSYNYTEQRASNRNPSPLPSPLPSRTPLQGKPSVSPSPANRLRSSTETEPLTKQREVSRSPIGRRAKITRHYTYVD